MPSSYYGFISDVIDKYYRLYPQTVLNIGSGFGKWEFLFREYGDVMRGRLEKEDWKITIDSIEIFEPYIKDYHRYLCNTIYIDNAFDIINKLHKYDFISAFDVIEHFPKDIALQFIKKLREKSKYLIMSIPLGDCWKQGKVFNNESETHLSVWYNEDFKDCTEYLIKNNSANKSLGLFIYKNTEIL